MHHTLMVFLWMLWSPEPVDSIRWVGGGSWCNGSLEIQRRGEWTKVAFQFWTLSFAVELCKQLDCGAPLSIREGDKDHGTSWTPNANCDGPSLTKCFRGTKRIIHSTELTCSDSVRLVDGTNLCSGRLEVNLNQSWSSVCEADFDQQDAEVVCRELDCGPPSVLQGALYGEVEAPTWSREFHCEGTEAALLDCRRSASARNTCSPGRAVGLTCSELVRLVEGASPCAGVVEVKRLGKWKRVIQINSNRLLKEVEKICRQLDCGSAVSVKARSGNITEPITSIWETLDDRVQSGHTISGFTSQPSDHVVVTCLEPSAEPDGATDGKSRHKVSVFAPVFIFTLVLLLLSVTFFVSALCFTYKVSRGQRSEQQLDAELKTRQRSPNSSA